MSAEQIGLSEIGSIIQDMGIWFMFAWLYVNEKRSHQHTREQYREDLREIANLRSRLSPIQSNERQAISE